MKKLFAGIMSAIMALSLCTTAFATESVIEQNGSKGIDVQAKVVYINPDNVYDVPVKDGKASLTTINGAVINIAANDATLDNLTLNVIEVVSVEKEAYNWVSDIMSKLCNKFTAYDIYFTDKDGNRVDITDNVTVSITTPNDYTNVQVYHIGYSAKPDKIISKQLNNNTVFTTNSFSYYVLADKGTDNGGTIDPTKPENPNSPQTGDTSNRMLWLALLLTSGGTLTVLRASKKRRKANEK